MVHTLSLLPASPYASGHFVCNICRESGCGPVYHCADCDFDVHTTCAATAKQQTHISHPQHLLHLVQCSTLRHTCDSCGTRIHSLSFRCDVCDFDIHPTCARAPRFIKHPRHRHPLTLQSGTSSGVLECDACRQPVRKLFYQCNICEYVLHQVCASLPTQVKHPKHQQHILKLLDEPFQEETFWCNGCGARSRGWRFDCTHCNFSLDPACATSVHEFAQPQQDLKGVAQDRSEATSSSTTSVVPNNMSHASVLNSVSQAPMPSDNEWEAFEKVLNFAQALARGRSSIDATQDVSAQSIRNEEEDIWCPTCLEGYDLGNPKKLTSCGHHFHLACILNWMEESSSCPICRKFVSIPM